MTMRFAFTRDQEALRDALRDVLKRECPPALVRASWEKRDAADALWKTLAELGVVGLTVPEEYGGLGLGALDWILLFEECGKFAAPVPLVETMAIAVPLICDAGDEAFKTRWLPAIAKGEARVAIGLESAPYVRDADVADLFLIQRGDAFHPFTPDQVRFTPHPSVDRSRRLFAVDHPATGDAPARGGFPNGGPLATSAQLLGLASHMLTLTVDYAKVRTQFGAPIGSFQAVKHHLANALLKIELARPAVYRAAHSVAVADPDASTHVSIAKACASDAATFVARVALQCHGAIGYSFEHDLHLWMKRTWALAAAWGDAAWHRARVASTVIDHPPSTGATP
jgi:alkylation response protein AidB-like acyl-CoA dehydrogenase